MNFREHGHWHQTDPAFQIVPSYEHEHDLDPAFELGDSDCHSCGEHSAPHFNIECGHEHRILGTNITFLPGDFVYWDSELESYVPAVEGLCDLMILRVDIHGTWFEAANIGEFQIKDFEISGSVYLDSTGKLTNTETNTKIGFIEEGHIYLSIQPTSSGGGGTPYTLPVATTSVLGGVKVGPTLEIDGAGVLDINDGAFIKNQKASAQVGNAWIDGSIYTGEDIEVAGDTSNVLSGFKIAESIIIEDLFTGSTFNSTLYTDFYTQWISDSVAYGRNPETWEPLEGYVLKNVDLGEVVTFAEMPSVGYGYTVPPEANETFYLQWLQTNIAQGKIISQLEYLTLTQLQILLGNAYLGPVNNDPEINLSGKGLNNFLGSHDSKILNFIKSAILNSADSIIGNTSAGMTTNLSSALIANSSNSKILNVPYASLENTQYVTIGFEGPNVMNSSRISMKNASYCNLVAGENVSISDSYGINLAPTGPDGKSTMSTVFGSSNLNLMNLERTFIAGVDGNVLQNVRWGALLASYGIRAYNLESSVIFATSNSYINTATDGGHLDYSAIIGGVNIYLTDGAFLHCTLVTGGAIRFTGSTWYYNLISGNNHTLADTGVDAFNQCNVIGGVGHTLDNITFSVISGYEGTLHGIRSSVLAGHHPIFTNASHSFIAGENLTGEAVLDCVLVGNATSITRATGLLLATEGGTVTDIAQSVIIGGASTITDVSGSLVGGNNNTVTMLRSGIVLGNANTLTNSELSYLFGGTNTLDASYYSMVVGSTNNASGLLNSLITGFGNTLTNAGSGILLNGSSNTVTGIANGILMLAGNSNIITNSSGPIFGDSNTVTGSDNVLVNGENHNLTNSDYALINGYAITVNGTSNYALLVSGNRSTLQNSSGAIFGESHIVTNSEIILMNGYSNRIDNGDYSIISGSDIQILGTANYSFIGGTDVDVVADIVVNKSILYGRSIIVDTGELETSIVVGEAFTVSGLRFSAVFGYEHNTISGSYNIVAGEKHINTGSFNAVFGYNNEARGMHLLLTGRDNIVGDNCDGVAVFGLENSVLSDSSRSLVSGYRNKLEINSYYSAILGGTGNTLSDSAYASAIIGGQSNKNTGGYYSTILGGADHTMTQARYSSIIGGAANTSASNQYSSIISSVTSTLRNATSGSILSSIAINSQSSLTNSTILSASGVTTALDKSIDTSIIAGLNSTINANLTCSFMMAQNSSVIGYLSYSLLMGMNNNVATQFEYGYIGGIGNTVAENHNGASILHSTGSSMLNVTRGAIIGGMNNVIGAASSPQSYSNAILGGEANVIRGNYSVVIGGSHNTIGAEWAAIISGTYNTVNARSVIIGGLGNVSGYDYQVIAGEYNENFSDSILELGWGTSDTTRKTVFRVTNTGISEQVGLIMKPQTSNPPIIVDGQMFAKADGLYVQIGGVLYKVNLTPA